MTGGRLLFDIEVLGLIFFDSRNIFIISYETLKIFTSCWSFYKNRHCVYYIFKKYFSLNQYYSYLYILLKTTFASPYFNHILK